MNPIGSASQRFPIDAASSSAKPRIKGTHQPFGRTSAQKPAPASPSTQPAGPLSSPASGSPQNAPAAAAKKFVARILEDEDAVDKSLARIVRGKNFSPQQLIALQAKVIKYSQELEVATRMIDKLTSAVKQTMQTQV